MKFSEQMKKAMQQLNITQAQVVSMTGCSKGAISMYLNDKCEPGNQKKRGIAISLGLAPDFFEQAEPDVEKAVVTPSDKSGIHRITLKELTTLLGVDKETASKIAVGRELPGLYGCKGSGEKFVYIINEAVFCKV
ncbi:MAG: helix-turn-helix transcriptional regulator [Lachnospiraceae bacterium]|nr:helix-turn-helix transcriptional regulator [Lachnospiraceae bacterium]